jgi:hypothetical protein
VRLWKQRGVKRNLTADSVALRDAFHHGGHGEHRAGLLLSFSSVPTVISVVTHFRRSVRLSAGKGYASMPRGSGGLDETSKPQVLRLRTSKRSSCYAQDDNDKEAAALTAKSHRMKD